MKHTFSLRTEWTGDRGSGTSGVRDYDRSVVIQDAAVGEIQASAARPFRGDDSKWNPETLLLGALAECHVLSYLHVAATSGVVVTGMTCGVEGELEVELVPQGTLAEKLRAGGAGIPAFYTRSGVGTQVAEGGLPMRYDADGTVVKSSQAKPTDTFVLGEGYLSQTPDEPETYVLERSIVTDFSLVHAWKGDRHGNLVFRKATRQFGPPAAMAGRVCIAQVEELVEPGEIDPDDVHLPGVFVHRIVEVGTDIEKRIEKRTVRASGEEQA